MEGRIHSIETFGTVDGPGTRLVVFMQGCLLRCKYCHNRDSWPTTGGYFKTSDDIIDEYLKYQEFYSDGGITISGGEPLLQIDFVIEVFKKAKKLGIHTCVDTSGGAYNKNLIDKYQELIKYTDLFLLDIKQIDREKHIFLTERDNTNILEFALFLSENSKDMRIRYVLVPTINDSEKDIIEFKKFIDKLNNVTGVEVLPYHNLGVSKWEKLGLKYPFKDIKEANIDDINRFVEIYKKN